MDISNMALNFNQSQQAKAETKAKVETLNSELKAKGFKHKERLGQSEFLTLLVTQLKHQDPLSPLENKDFIAQMAQFSSLEQMTKVNTNIGKLINQAADSGNYNLLGKQVMYHNPTTDRMITGTVSSLERREGELGLIINKQWVKPENLITIEEKPRD